ncbi:hypothetical protein ACXPWS_18945 [Mycobacterium sp. BMJ-28]
METDVVIGCEVRVCAINGASFPVSEPISRRAAASSTHSAGFCTGTSVPGVADGPDTVATAAPLASALADAFTSGVGSGVTVWMDTVLSVGEVLFDGLGASVVWRVGAASALGSGLGGADAISGVDTLSEVVAGVCAGLRLGARAGVILDPVAGELADFGAEPAGSVGSDVPDVVVAAVPESFDSPVTGAPPGVSECVPAGELEDVESVSPGSAHATPGTDATAVPIPRATASAPTRPMYLEDPMTPPLLASAV